MGKSQIIRFGSTERGMSGTGVIYSIAHVSDALLQIYEILMTKQGQTSDEYKESVFYGEV